MLILVVMDDSGVNSPPIAVATVNMSIILKN